MFLENSIFTADTLVKSSKLLEEIHNLAPIQHTDTDWSLTHFIQEIQEIASFEVSSMTQKNKWSHYCIKNLKVLSEIPKPRALLVQSTFSRQYFITRSVVTRHVESLSSYQLCLRFQRATSRSRSWTVLPPRSFAYAKWIAAARFENASEIASQSGKLLVWLGPNDSYLRCIFCVQVQCYI